MPLTNKIDIADKNANSLNNRMVTKDELMYQLKTMGDNFENTIKLYTKSELFKKGIMNLKKSVEDKLKSMNEIVQISLSILMINLKKTMRK